MGPVGLDFNSRIHNEDVREPSRLTMPTSHEILQLVSNYRTTPKKNYYSGPTIYRGHEISMRHSLRRVSRTVLKLLVKTQFASLNIVGIPGSGKTTLAVNLCTDLMEMASKEKNLNFSFAWWGPDELRHLGENIDNLPKGQDHIRVCDDVSKALDQLPAKDQAEVFQQLTTTRHTTGGKLLLISLYHYTYANLKSIKSQAVINIYTSVSLVEKLNILAMVGKDGKSVQRLNSFIRVYSQSIDNDEFTLKISPGKDKVFYDWRPFHPCFVINLFKVHLSLYMRIENSPLWPEDKKKLTLPTNELFERGRKAYKRDFDHALKIIGAQNGHYNKDNVNFARAYNYAQKLRRTYNFIWPEIMNTFNAKQVNRIQKNRKIEREMDDAFKKLAFYKEPEKITKTEETKEHE